MMGRLNRDQGQLFYSFCLDQVVPDDHQVRDKAGVCVSRTVLAGALRNDLDVMQANFHMTDQRIVLGEPSESILRRLYPGNGRLRLREAVGGPGDPTWTLRGSRYLQLEAGQPGGTGCDERSWQSC